MEGGKEQNYWPGFVDALSNVVLTLVFVLVIFVFALLITASKVQHNLEIAVAKKNEEHIETSTKQIQDLAQQLAAAQEEIRLLREGKPSQPAAPQVAPPTSPASAVPVENKDIAVEEAPPENDKAAGTITVKGTADAIVLTYPISSYKLDDKAQKELKRAFTEVRKKPGKFKVVLKSVLGKETYSVAQRFAFYRAIEVRNYLIANEGIGAGDISSTIVSSSSSEEGRVEIVFEKQ